jgi:hypothetical protein
MPELQPFFAQWSTTDFEDGASGAVLAVVPADKLLIIEDVTVEVSVPHGAAMVFCIQAFGGPIGTAGRYSTTGRNYWIPLTQRHAASDEDWLVGGRRVRWYIESGADVAYFAEGENATTGRVNVTVSGRFVDLPPKRPFNSLRRAFRLIFP